MKKNIYIVFLLFYLSGFSQTKDYQVSIATSKAYPLSMGGAFATMEHPIDALYYNPAGLNLNSQNRNQLFVFYNPIGIAAIGQNWDMIKSERLPVEWIIRGMGLKLGRVSLGLHLSEESILNINDYQDVEFLKMNHYNEMKNGSFGVSITLAPRVIFGAAAEISYDKELDDEAQWGYRYGIILKPKDYLSFGICYLDLPNNYSESRIPLERLTDESLNIGFVFKPANAFKFALDVRNVSDPTEYIAREPHAGIEIIPFHHLALRGGYFQTSEDQVDNYSFGLGLIDINTFVPHERRLSYGSLGINMTYLIQKDAFETLRWFIFSSHFYF